MQFFRTYLFTALTGFLLITGCTAPRSVIHSGKVTPKGEFKVGTNYAFNVATQPIGALSDVGSGFVKDLKNRDTVFLDNQVNNISRAALAYSLDPATPSWDFYVRYGIIDRVDLGYKYAFGSHVFDAMYQFMGSTGSIKNPGTPGTYGSIGLQYSSRDYKLPGKVLWQDIDDLLQYNASRTDILVPLVFSTSFGPEEEMGNISYGVAYSHTWINYSFKPTNFVQQQADKQDIIPVKPLSAKNNFGAFGAFVNAKFGYRYVYVLPALAMYYQNYGKYELLGGKQTELKGFTFIPSLGLQFQFGKGR